MARPFTNGVEWGWKKCTDPMVGGARSIFTECIACPLEARGRGPIEYFINCAHYVSVVKE